MSVKGVAANCYATFSTDRAFHTHKIKNHGENSDKSTVLKDLSDCQKKYFRGSTRETGEK